MCLWIWFEIEILVLIWRDKFVGYEIVGSEINVIWDDRVLNLIDKLKKN